MRYRTNVRKRLLKHREQHLREVNKKSTYKTIEIREKPTILQSSGAVHLRSNNYGGNNFQTKNNR